MTHSPSVQRPRESPTHLLEKRRWAYDTRESAAPPIVPLIRHGAPAVCEAMTLTRRQ
jgi:hypothetical protein